LEHVKNHSLAAGQAIHGAVKEHGPGAWEHVKSGSAALAHHAGNAARAAHGAIKEHGPGVLETLKNGTAAVAQSGTVAPAASAAPVTAAPTG
jgi:hypothetical protein